MIECLGKWKQERAKGTGNRIIGVWHADNDNAPRTVGATR